MHKSHMDELSRFWSLEKITKLQRNSARNAHSVLLETVIEEVGHWSFCKNFWMRIYHTKTINFNCKVFWQSYFLKNTYHQMVIVYIWVLVEGIFHDLEIEKVFSQIHVDFLLHLTIFFIFFSFNIFWIKFANFE